MGQPSSQSKFGRIMQISSCSQTQAVARGLGGISKGHGSGGGGGVVAQSCQ